MPVLLSSPMDISTTYAKQNIIQISSVLIPKQQKSSNTKRQKKPYDKRPKSPHSSSSSDENENKAKHNNNSKKATHELLSEDQKRANHIASEQKRRANIRIGFEKLVDIVPTLNTGHRSEALILQKCITIASKLVEHDLFTLCCIAIDHLKQLLESKTLLKERARQLQLMLGEM